MAEEAQTAPPAPAAEADLPGVKPEITGDKPLAVSEAARQLSQWRQAQRHLQAQRATREGRDTQEQAQAPAAEATVEPDERSASPVDTASPQEGPGEVEEGSDLAQEPAIAPPKSWSRDARQYWDQLPPEVQDYVSKRENERHSLVSRRENELADEVKKTAAERQQLQQSRSQYDQALPALLQTLQTRLAGDFADIQNMDDVKKMAKEDWGRYMQWDAAQKEIAAISADVSAGQQRQVQEQRAAFVAFAQDADKKFIERNPDFADKEKAARLQDAAVVMLQDLGFSPEEITRHWSGQDFLSLRDPRVQEIIANNVRFLAAKAATRKVTAKQLPPVQRPGVAQPAPNAERALQAAQSRFNQTQGTLNQVRAGVELLKAQRALNSRR